MTPHLRSSRAHLLVLGTALVLIAQPAFAQVQGDPQDLPVLGAETPRGDGVVTAAAPVAPTAKVVDGDVSDWVGDITRYGGTAIYSKGEYVYQDHLFDANGADDGRDTARFEQTDQLEDIHDGFYRIDALSQADAPGQLGVDSPEQYRYDDTYGDAAPWTEPNEIRVQNIADLEEVRVAVDGEALHLLARTTTMRPDIGTTGLLLLADTHPGETEREVPFNSGITTVTGDVAVFLSGDTGYVADLASGEVAPLPAGSVVTNDTGFVNAVEAALPLDRIASATGLSIALGAGRAAPDGTGFMTLPLEVNDGSVTANIANVAFRLAEPARVWFEMDQALTLYRNTIDPFFATIDVGELAAGTTETYAPGHGYHDRIFISDSTPGVATENDKDGLFQHYGVYLPAAYDGTAQLPAQWWLHWRGGTAHIAAAVIPKMIKQYGEDKDTIVISPSGRGTSRWYVGKGHVDFLEVWDDALGTYEVDRDRVYVSGHSMGGFGSFLLTVLYPDRFAAGVPVSPPVTQGAWTGLDFPGCDSFSSGEYSFCYIQANQGNARAQHTRRLLANLRHVPLAIFTGAQDYLVPVTGVVRQAEQLTLLGYRHRLYLDVAAEHFTPPAIDQWAQVATYEHLFTRPKKPAQVTYIRDMPFERATEISRSDGLPLNFDFDSAYWMSELRPPDADAAQPTGVASFDGRSLAITDPEDDPWAAPYLAIPDTDTPTGFGQAGPHVVTGLQWIDDPSTEAPPPVNAFEATLTGAERVRLDLDRMNIDPNAPVHGTVSTNTPLALRLDGDWASAPIVTVDGEAVETTLDDGVVTFTVPVGTDLAITIGELTLEGAV